MSSQSVCPRTLVIGLPKAGTHLLNRTLLLMGVSDSHAAINVGTICYFHGKKLPYLGSIRNPAGSRLLVGVDSPRYVARRRVLRLLEKVQPGSFASAHLIYDFETARILEEQSFKTISIIRDPRDVAVSHFLYVMREATHFLHKYYMKMDSDGERLMFSITGGQYRGNRICNIGERVQGVLRWDERELNLATMFEKLIGAKGGGSEEVQLAEIERIAVHLGLDLSSSHIRHIGEEVFSRSSRTFRKGEIGDWRSSFGERHKAAIKKVAGSLLVELGYEIDENW